MRTFLFSLLVFLPTALYSEGITGSVVSDEGALVAGLPVLITREANNVSQIAVTDSLGNFSATGLAAGTYTVGPINNLANSQEVVVQPVSPWAWLPWNSSENATQKVEAFEVPSNWSGAELKRICPEC